MTKQKTQIVIIHGGMTFKTRADYVAWLKARTVSLEKRNSWKNDLEKKVSKIADVVQPKMPGGDNAKYEDWKIHFERILPLLNKNVIFIGNSLGSIFLAKYLSEHKIKNNIIATYLVAAPFDNTLTGEDLVGGFRLGKDLSLISKQSNKTTLFFSADDDVVPLSHAQKFMKKLPDAEVVVYESKNGHFDIETFPELVKMVKEDLK